MPRNVVISEEITGSFSPDEPQLARQGFFAAMWKKLLAAILREIPIGYQGATGFRYGTPARDFRLLSERSDASAGRPPTSGL
jgi:hypothetical protein